MADDPRFQWRLANPMGILVNEKTDAWYSGHANDMLEMASGALLVATHTGGVWTVNPGNTSLCLSDSWSNPNLFCLAKGPDDDQHIFSGGTGGSIRETDLGESLPLLSWKEIDHPLPADAGDVHCIAIVPRLRRIVAACENGLFWSSIPPTNPRPGCLGFIGPKNPPRPPYDWKKATVEGETATFGFWKVAIGATKNNQLRSELEDHRLITIVAGAYLTGGVYTGQWDNAGGLVLRRAKIHNDDGSDASGLFFLTSTCSVSSCEVKPTVLYAACAAKSVQMGQLFRVLRSTDGGRSWGICGWDVPNAQDDLLSLAGDQGADWNNVIAVSPTNPDLVALGWISLFITLDSGKTWRLVDPGSYHSDLHGLRFYPETAGDIHNLYVCSDGGLMRLGMDDYLNTTGTPFQTNYNSVLPTIQCYSNQVFAPKQAPGIGRMFYGSMGVSNTTAGSIATGVQDNGNLHCFLFPTITPWKDMDGGDGGWMAFTTDGTLLHNTMGGPVAARSVAPGGGFADNVIIPVVDPPAPDGISGPVGEPVKKPSFKNEQGQLLMALAGSKAFVYGLFVGDFDHPRYHWDLLATVPDGEEVTSLASFTGGTVFAGTNKGKIYAIDSRKKTRLELPVVLPSPAPGATVTAGGITRIVVRNDHEAFAIMNFVSAKIPKTFGIGTPTSLTSFYVLRLETLHWVVPSLMGFPGEEMFAIELVDHPHSETPNALLVATDDRVYVSNDNGDHWQRASLNLPRNPHCADLRYETAEGRTILYLSTYGRSVWMTDIR